MAHLYRTPDVQAAVRLASDFRSRGQYDWFRGQLQIWPLRSTRVRLRPDQEEDAVERLRRFENWLKSARGLEPIASDVNAAFAVGQHYGLPTNYIDFTTSPEVAGFFAADNPTQQPVTRESCIICLNTSDLRRFWETLPPKYPPPECIRLSVPNLWRLEAQEGCFLFCPYSDFENIYDLDRIVFPYTGPATNIPRTKIYPDRKSALEILLDLFFMTERGIEGSRRLNQLSAFREMAHLQVADQGGWERELFKGDPDVLDSWSEAHIRDWIDPHLETFSDVYGGPSLSLDFPHNAGHADLRTQTETTMLQHLARDASLRARAVRWEFRGQLTESQRKQLASRLARLWDGIRTLPYDAAQVAHSIAQCVALWRALGDSNIALEETMRSVAEACFGEAIEVSFGPEDGSYALAFAEGRLLLNAVRKDLADYLDPQWAPQIAGNLTGILQAIHDPRRAFDFLPLADAFARQLAPFQVVFRPGEVAHFYSPARLHRFGLP